MSFKRVYDVIEEEIETIVEKAYGNKTKIPWKKTPNIKLGDVSFPLFALSKQLNKDIKDIAEKIQQDLIINDIVEKVELKGGFLNVFLNRKLFAKNVVRSIVMEKEYGRSNKYEKERIIIEHTSSNPTGPIHVGNFRGSVLGDVLSRLFNFLGAAVNTRYYVNDLGKQVAPLVIGYHLLKEINLEADCKIDLWIGKIYAAMNTFLEIQTLKEDLYSLGIVSSAKPYYSLSSEEYSSLLQKISNSAISEKERNSLTARLKKYYTLQDSLHNKIPGIYDTLLNLLSERNVNLREEATKLLSQYQSGPDDTLKEKVREVVNAALSGHTETLNLFDIYHDDFDWESEIAWSGDVETILAELENGGWIRKDGLARLLLNDKIATELGFKEKYGLKYTIPDTILVNSDGIALYPCRDIAYHLHKLDKFDATLCYNVIGKQQQLPQLAVRLALYALDKKDIADRIVHFDYEYVTLVGRKMSGRELEYVTPDELYELSRAEIKKILKDRGYTPEEEEEIASKVALSSVRYHILKIDPQKQVVFDPKKAVDPNENTGPFLQYSYARAVNILKKAKERGIELNFLPDIIDNLEIIVSHDEEWTLIKTLEELPYNLTIAAEQLRPDFVANFAYTLSSVFHKFYDTCPVIAAEDDNIRTFRLFLVYAVIKALESLFKVIGIKPLEKM